MPAEAARERVHDDFAGHATGGAERPDVAARHILLAVGGFFLFAAASLAVIGFTYNRVAPDTTGGPVRSFPEPRLQSSPEADLARMRSEQGAALGGYAWIDRPAGIVRIPIGDAMAVLARRGQAAFDAPDGPERTPPLGSRGGATGPQRDAAPAAGSPQ